ncbi:hypothetical protein KIW84_032594 [Lathyrus oleraceus]|uniref:60S ribosomal protein L17 n=1 Tax=Pisum sativum TaxID=3888 RepID=A0A9D4XUC2_PEA|nr:hypothetical protein KIW84_032594 [Pisum sativum]
MDKEGGLPNLLDSSLICSRMQGAMPKSKDWMLMLYIFLISKSIKHRSKDAEHTELNGIINPYMSSPCHIELVLSEKEEPVKKEPETRLASSKKRA